MINYNVYCLASITADVLSQMLHVPLVRISLATYQMSLGTFARSLTRLADIARARAFPRCCSNDRDAFKAGLNGLRNKFCSVVARSIG